MELTETQQNRVKEILNKNPEATLTEITSYVYEDENIDSRSKEGRILKQYLLDNNIEYKNRSVFQRDRIKLTKDQEEFIKNNYSSDILYAYDNLIPGAYKADLFRYYFIQL